MADPTVVGASRSRRERGVAAGSRREMPLCTLAILQFRAAVENEDKGLDAVRPSGAALLSGAKEAGRL